MNMITDSVQIVQWINYMTHIRPRICHNWQWQRCCFSAIETMLSSSFIAIPIGLIFGGFGWSWKPCCRWELPFDNEYTQWQILELHLIWTKSSSWWSKQDKEISYTFSYTRFPRIPVYTRIFNFCHVRDFHIPLLYQNCHIPTTYQNFSHIPAVYPNPWKPLFWFLPWSDIIFLDVLQIFKLLYITLW